MAALRGILKGSRGEASRLGSSKSGIRADLNTWGRRVTVELQADGSAYVSIKDYSPATGETGPFFSYRLPSGRGAAKLKRGPFYTGQIGA